MFKEILTEKLAENVARNMLAKRKEKDWSQAEAAEACELSDRYYGEIECRHANPTLGALAGICIGFEMTLEELVANPIEEGSAC